MDKNVDIDMKNLLSVEMNDTTDEEETADIEASVDDSKCNRSLVRKK